MQDVAHFNILELSVLHYDDEVAIYGGAAKPYLYGKSRDLAMLDSSRI